MLESMGGLDDVFGDAFDEFLRAMPLRSMASMSGGKVSWSQLDLLIEGLNAEPPSSDTPLDAGPQEH